ncbi:hypothetical protein [Alkalihalobacterium alkalinitrilicum]|uniref:hypothetical protein n=1 Tax=Alkalihalobacterium alkalinitrilicum TaxID=427920 RepID=UPI001EE4E95F|nr:hypothetical protein [Alkalihalobacterium alkalinitrilicum]
MAIKPREEAVALKIWRYLNGRSILSEKEDQYYLNLERGYKGEQAFDKWLEKRSMDCLVLNDLLLECTIRFFKSIHY